MLDFITNSVDANNILLGERGIPLSSEVANAISPQMDETSQEIIKFINEVVSPKCSQVNPPQPDGYTEANEGLKQNGREGCVWRTDSGRGWKGLL